MINKERSNLQNEILGFIDLYGIETSKCDIFGENPMEDRVYTKRINIGKNFGDISNNTEIVCVSLTSDNPLDGTISVMDVRINTKNRNGKWCNIFLTEAPLDMLKFVKDEIEKNI